MSEFFKKLLYKNKPAITVYREHIEKERAEYAVLLKQVRDFVPEAMRQEAHF